MQRLPTSFLLRGGCSLPHQSGRETFTQQGKIMSRKEALNKLREVLLVRREALRKALAGDLSLLRQYEGGDVVDVATETTQDEISSQLAEVKAVN